MTENSNPLGALTSFHTMLTPKIITIVYFVGLAGVLIAGCFAIFNGMFVKGILTLVFGGIGWRIWCELTIVLFKINENIQRIAEK